MATVIPVPGARMRELTDEELVRRAREGEERAFAEIVRRYREPLRRYCARRVGADHAEDIVQHAFERATMHLRSDPRPMQLRVWLYRVAHNKALNLAERKDFAWEPLPVDLDGVPQPPEIAADRARFRRFVAEISDLPERQREALVLRVLEGCDYEQIADRLGTSSERVRGLISRARTQLRQAAIALAPLPLLRRLAAGAGGAPAAAGSGAGAMGGKLVALATATAVAGTGGTAMLASQASALTEPAALERVVGQLGAGTPSAILGEPRRPAPVTAGALGGDRLSNRMPAVTRRQPPSPAPVPVRRLEPGPGQLAPGPGEPAENPTHVEVPPVEEPPVDPPPVEEVPEDDVPVDEQPIEPPPEGEEVPGDEFPGDEVAIEVEIGLIETEL